jgi:hypothetical protein
MRRADAFLVRMAVLVDAADVRFIDFDFAHQAAKLIVVEHGADAMADVESGLVRGRAIVFLKHPLDLQGAHALLALADQVDYLEPNRKRVIRILKHRANQGRKAIAIFLVADRHQSSLFVHAFLAALADPIPRAMFDREYLVIAASRASHAIRPTQADQQRHAFVLGVELFVNLLKANHERTLHQMLGWCQVRQISAPSGSEKRFALARRGDFASLADWQWPVPVSP